MVASNVTAIVGVPALWETLRRRLMQRFSDKSVVLETFIKATPACKRVQKSKYRVINTIEEGVAFYNEMVDTYLDGEPLERPQTHFSRTGRDGS